MQQVTKSEFYTVLWAEAKDVITSLSGNYPYLCKFVYRGSQKEFGRHDPQGQYWIY